MSLASESGLLLVVGLTGVGKSTVLAEVLRVHPSWRLLPNRRELADRIIFPEVQKRMGQRTAAVRDRVERFRLTAAYREMHPGGMAHALEGWLHQERQTAGHPASTMVFDNLRGLDEVAAAVDAFHGARFLLLDATPATRLARLLERRDPFDGVSVADEARAASDPLADVERAARIIVEEQRNYDSSAARRHLEQRLPRERFLAVDTDDLSQAEVARRVLAWLKEDA